MSFVKLSILVVVVLEALRFGTGKFLFRTLKLYTIEFKIIVDYV